jgi:hypothetical protein
MKDRCNAARVASRYAALDVRFPLAEFFRATQSVLKDVRQTVADDMRYLQVHRGAGVSPPPKPKKRAPASSAPLTAAPDDLEGFLEAYLQRVASGYFTGTLAAANGEAFATWMWRYMNRSIERLPMRVAIPQVDEDSFRATLKDGLVTVETRYLGESIEDPTTEEPAQTDVAQLDHWAKQVGATLIAPYPFEWAIRRVPGYTAPVVVYPLNVRWIFDTRAVLEEALGRDELLRLANESRAAVRGTSAP